MIVAEPILNYYKSLKSFSFANIYKHIKKLTSISPVVFQMDVADWQNFGCKVKTLPIIPNPKIEK